MPPKPQPMWKGQALAWKQIHALNRHKQIKAETKKEAAASKAAKKAAANAASVNVDPKDEEATSAAAVMNLENEESAFTDEVKEMLQKLPSKDLTYPKGTEVVYIFKHKQLPYLKVGKYVIRDSGLAKDRFENRNLDNIAHPDALQGLMQKELFELVAAAPFCYDRVEMRLRDSKATPRIIEKRDDAVKGKGKSKGATIHKTEFHPLEQLPQLLQALVAFYEENKQIAKDVLQLVEPSIPAPPSAIVEREAAPEAQVLAEPTPAPSAAAALEQAVPEPSIPAPPTSAMVEQTVPEHPVRLVTSGALANRAGASSGSKRTLKGKRKTENLRYKTASLSSFIKK